MNPNPLANLPRAALAAETLSNDEGVPGLVSVIVPVYNTERFLRQALDSIVAQTYAPLELIVVDDGSTDSSGPIAQSYAPARYLVQPNQGNGSAKNTGLAAARGEFIAFLDADDVWPPDKLSAQVETLRQNPPAGFTTGRMVFFFEPGIERPGWVPRYFLTDPQPAYLPSGLLIRRTTFGRVGLFDPSYPIINDLEWLARARDAGVADVVTEQVVVRRRVHGGNLTYQAAARAQELLRALHGSARRKSVAAPGPGAA
jgi:glycosyltransferase involved in cell wall biosynthesis